MRRAPCRSPSASSGTYRTPIGGRGGIWRTGWGKFERMVSPREATWLTRVASTAQRRKAEGEPTFMNHGLGRAGWGSAAGWRDGECACGGERGARAREGEAARVGKGIRALTRLAVVHITPRQMRSRCGGGGPTALPGVAAVLSDGIPLVPGRTLPGSDSTRSPRPCPSLVPHASTTPTPTTPHAPIIPLNAHRSHAGPLGEAPFSSTEPGPFLLHVRSPVFVTHILHNTFSAFL